MRLNKTRVLHLVFGAAASLFSSSLLAQDASTQAPAPSVKASVQETANLQRHLAGFDFFSADFVQQLLNKEGKLLQRLEGKLQLQKPNLLNWQAKAPYQQQVVVDGLQVWLYDPDLEQVTVKPLTQDVSQAPALILAGKFSDISQHYRIKQLESEVFELTPKQDNPLFVSLRLSFAEQSLTELLIVDKLEQHTQVKLSKFDKVTPIAKTEFTFIAPEGTDVLHDK